MSDPASPRPIRRLLVANRGEIAVRVMRAAAEMEIETIALHSADDADALHVRKADRAVSLPGVGPRAYLDAEGIARAAAEAGADAVHPGYGFLSENAGFARACAAAGLTFVGPSPEALELFGDKSAARALAAELGVPMLPGTGRNASLEEVTAFFESLGPNAAVMIKAAAGGGGRGMRRVTDAADLAEAYARCKSEAKMAFGSDEVYAERLIRRARHIEVQVLGDGASVTHLWERDCTLQRRNQKIVEIAPAPFLDPDLRARILDAALTMAGAAAYRALGTFEFLVDRDADRPEHQFAFMEANPRLQVEHTVTEEITGLDLVKLQIRAAEGASLADLGLAGPPPEPRGHAVQLRLNAETYGANGLIKPASGTLTAFDLPSGPGVRVDTAGFAGFRTNPGFDTLLAKLICHDPSPDYAAAVRRTYRALCEFRIEGVATNAAILRNLLTRPDFLANDVDTGFLEAHAAELTAEAAHPARHAVAAPAAETAAAAAPDAAPDLPEGAEFLRAPIEGSVIALTAEPEVELAAGSGVIVLEAMKMEHGVTAPAAGRILRFLVQPGQMATEGQPVAIFAPDETLAGGAAEAAEIDLDHIRPDLAEAMERRRMTRDEARPDAVARRRKTGQRTARENVADLTDGSPFTEYGGLVIAAQRTRRPIEDLIARTPADGLVAGVGHVNGNLFEADKARCAVLAYDYTVLAGTQGWKNHAKTDRLLTVAGRRRLPLVFFTEGGGGRPGDTDFINSGGLDTPTFHMMAAHSGLAPMIGVVSGRCFAGNAAALGLCDVIIATENTNLGMGGPAMIEGGGLGVYTPEQVGPMSVQVPNGVVDVLVKDEAEAVATAKKYLSYFQGPVKDWTAPDQRRLRHVVPENRRQAYDIRAAIDLIADEGSVLELRRGFGHGMITSLIRVGGQPMGVVANNPMHLGGAIDSPAADKAARFMTVCDAHDVPVLYLCDTPGNMVGPEAEKTGLVRHCSRLFLVGANLTVPFFTVVLRKGYGLGAQGMAGGGFHNPLFIVSWPTGEFGGMGLEGFVRLGFRDKLAAIADPEAREAEFQRLVAAEYSRGAALSAASLFEIDDVIDPAETRTWIGSALDTPWQGRGRGPNGKKHAWIDAW